MTGYYYKTVAAPTTATTFGLKQGQYLRVMELPYGAVYELQELSPTTYAASYSIDGGSFSAPGTVGATVSTGTQEITDPDHSATFKNTRNTEPPTGLDINDLPFLGLIALAVALMGALVAVKVRKARRQTRA
jgi:hypothetical protein